MSETMDPAEAKALRREFDEVVNMTPGALEKWLETDDSKAVGMTREGEQEAVGHQSGERIVGLLRKPAAKLDAEDFAHMRKVASYVRRHLAQGGPKADKEHSRWRHSLMNWGHDPLK